MPHIHQKNTEGSAYIVVFTWNSDLENHPCILNHPDKFEIVDGDPPSGSNFLNYQEPEGE